MQALQHKSISVYINADSIYWEFPDNIKCVAFHTDRHMLQTACKIQADRWRVDTYINTGTDSCAHEGGLNFVLFWNLKRIRQSLDW